MNPEALCEPLILLLVSYDYTSKNENVKNASTAAIIKTTS